MKTMQKQFHINIVFALL